MVEAENHSTTSVITHRVVKGEKRPTMKKEEADLKLRKSLSS